METKEKRQVWRQGLGALEVQGAMKKRMQGQVLRQGRLLWWCCCGQQETE